MLVYQKVKSKPGFSFKHMPTFSLAVAVEVTVTGTSILDIPLDASHMLTDLYPVATINNHINMHIYIIYIYIVFFEKK